METVNMNVQVSLNELLKLMRSLPESRADVMAREYGEVCSLKTAAKILSVTPRTVYKMMHDGRLNSACDEEKVDVRSIAAYIDKGKPSPQRVAKSLYRV